MSIVKKATTQRIIVAFVAIFVCAIANAADDNESSTTDEECFVSIFDGKTPKG